jgi:hypothetical protein
MDRDAIAQRRQERRAQEQRRRRQVARRRGGLAAGLVAAVAGGLFALTHLLAPDLGARGPAATAIGAARLSALRFTTEAADAEWRVDGEPAGAGRTYDGSGLGDGEHAVTVSARGPLPGTGSSRTWRFVVDTRPPRVRLQPENASFTRGAPLRLRGSVEQGARVWLDGRAVRVNGDRFDVELRSLAGGTLRLRARDTAGNESSRTVRPQLVARRPGGDVRAVHVTAAAWDADFLRKPVLQLIAEKRINAVQLDLKDEAGVVGYDTANATARRIGANGALYDLAAAVRTLHAKHIRVIGRIVAFRDPLYAAAAWDAGHRDEVVQTPAGAPYAGYGGFTNFANAAVRRYNIELAVEAAAAGVDEILYDYVRRPDGPLSTMRFPGLAGAPERAIVEFLAETRRALPAQTYLGASVFGVAATRPLEVAQDIPRMAREVDYIAPMVYPSHWGPGEYDVADPNAEPYAIVLASIRDFRQKVRGTGARIVPWLQDFTLGVDYGPREVRAQIDGAAKAGAPEFVLWDPLVTYTADALDPDAPPVDVVAAPPKTRRTAPPTAPAAPVSSEANELGEVPVLMIHQIRSDGGGDYDLTPKEFRALVARLYELDFRPITAAQFVTGRFDLPEGKSPVVLTFDDSTKEQLAYDEGGKIKADTAIGILTAFAREHPDFEPRGTFYVNREPFAGVAEGPAMLRWLHEHGFEIGNHTKDHLPLKPMDATDVQRQLVLGQRVITSAIAGYEPTTMALPLGVMPTPAALAVRGSWGGERYHHAGVFLVGAEPAASPFSRKLDRTAIPRINDCTSTEVQSYCAGYWLGLLASEPGRRYVSDGDPAHVTFPRARLPELAPRFRARAKPY